MIFQGRKTAESKKRSILRRIRRGITPKRIKINCQGTHRLWSPGKTGPEGKGTGIASWQTDALSERLAQTRGVQQLLLKNEPLENSF